MIKREDFGNVSHNYGRNQLRQLSSRDSWHKNYNVNTIGKNNFKHSDGNVSRDVDSQAIEIPSDSYKTLQEDNKVPVYQDASSISVNQIALASPVIFDRGKVLTSGSTIEQLPIPAHGDRKSVV